MARLKAVLFTAALGCAVVFPGRLSSAQSLVNNKQRVDFRDLGQRGSNLIEPDDSKITSLVTDPTTGRIYGATSGKRAQIFAFEPSTNHLRPLGLLPAAEGVHNAAVVAPDGSVYFGTGRDMSADPEISEDWGRELGHMHISKKLWADLEASYAGYPGGQIYRWDPSNWDRARYAANQDAQVQDLGIAVPGEGIYCLKLSSDAKMLYGVTYPHGKFFTFDIATRQAKVVGDTWADVIFAGPTRGLRSLPGDLVLDGRGRCYYTSDSGWVSYYDPATGKLVRTAARIPGEFYLQHNNFDIYHPVVECWTSGGRNEIYGGTNDGFLFRFDPGPERVTNLGKVRITRRLRALAAATDGRIYGVAG
ncbi:MAG TPA: hypothetical protein VJ417_04900, partial [Candidatus Glassbacteria bacterium]|nr:hypothetical protein [Candidatus Glassbacteria bacterium]